MWRAMNKAESLQCAALFIRGARRLVTTGDPDLTFVRKAGFGNLYQIFLILILIFQIKAQGVLEKRHCADKKRCEEM